MKCNKFGHWNCLVYLQRPKFRISVFIFSHHIFRLRRREKVRLVECLQHRGVRTEQCLGLSRHAGRLADLTVERVPGRCLNMIIYNLMLTQTWKFKTSNPLATEPALMKVDEAGSNCLATDVALATELDLPYRSPASLSTLRYFCETWSVLFRTLEIEFPMVSAGILLCHFEMVLDVFLHSLVTITLNNTNKDT